MNTPETINIEKYAEALNNLVGMDIGYLGDSDENVNAIVEVIRAAKKLENKVKELEEENERIRFVYSHVCVGDVFTQEDIEGFRMAHTEQGQHGDPVGPVGMVWVESFDEVRADTVRKMQERLKEELKEHYSLYFQILSYDLIDRIAKEVLEEN